MAVVIRRALVNDMAAIVSLAVEAQTDPERFCAYFGEDASSIAADIGDVAGPRGGNWTEGTWLALNEEGQVISCLLADADPEMGRVWWWGPIVADDTRLPVELRDETTDQLLAAAMASLDAFTEHEFAADGRSAMMRSFADRHGFAAEEASAVLRTEPFADADWTGDQDVVRLAERHHESVIELHDELFPGTHATGATLVSSDDVRLVLERPDDPSGERVAGYVAIEMHSDGSLYIDFLGVAVDQRGRGIGRRLISEAMRLGATSGATHAHLTVRAGNTAARRLYAAIGFVEERSVLPLRRGFSTA
jgi:ribosomal protein S18 acetylase RimI-like enzyme